jgi:hypothetical protein
MYVGLRDFHDTYFKEVACLETASEAFFAECKAGSTLRFDNGWMARRCKTGRCAAVALGLRRKPGGIRGTQEISTG